MDGDGTYTATITSSGEAHDVTITATDSSVTPTVSRLGTLVQTPVSAQSVRAALLPVLIPRHTTIDALLHSGRHEFTFAAPSAGELDLRWYLVMPSPRGHKSARILAGKFRATLISPAGRPQELKLTASGRSDLHDASRVVVSAIGTFTPDGGTATTVTKTFILKR